MVVNIGIWSRWGVELFFGGYVVVREKLEKDDLCCEGLW